MNKWTVMYESTGWSPQFNWPYVCFGDSSGSGIYDAETGSKRAWFSSWLAGWYSPTSIMGLNDTEGGQRRSVLNIDGTVLRLDSDPVTSVGAIADITGHWFSNHNGRVVRDGSVLAESSKYLGIQTAGEWFCFTANEGQEANEWQRWHIHVWHRDSEQRVIVPQVAALSGILHTDGSFTYGDSSRAFLNTAEGQSIDITATTPACEYAPLLREGYLWSVFGADAKRILVRQPGALQGYVLDAPWGVSAFDVVRHNEDLWIVWHDTFGRLGVGRVYLTETIALPYVTDASFAKPVARLEVVVEPGQLRCKIVTSPESGTLTTWRFFIDGVRQQTNVPEMTFPVNAGSHSVAARIAAKNGDIVDLPALSVVVTGKSEEGPGPTKPTIPPVEPSEPPTVLVKTLPTFFQGTNFMPPEPARQAFVDAGFNMVRVAIRDWTPEVFAQVMPTMTPLWIFTNEAELAKLPDGTPTCPTLAVFLNEPDLGDKAMGTSAISAFEYATRALPLAAVAKARNIRVYWCGASSTDSKGQAYLTTVLSKMGTWAEFVDLHRYPKDGERTQDWFEPKSGFDTMETEMSSLFSILHGRRYMFSEFGIKETSWTIGWWTKFLQFLGLAKKTKTFVDRTDQALQLKRITSWMRGLGNCDGGCVFQSSEAPEGPLFGVTDAQGLPKPALQCWK